MTAINIFYQGEGIREHPHFEADPDQTLAPSNSRNHRKARPPQGNAALSRGQRRTVRRAALDPRSRRPRWIKAHLHRCRHIEVAVTFNGETAPHQFGTGTTLARASNWAAEHKFGMTPQEAGEHVLQITGTKDRPDPGVHLGALRLARLPHRLRPGAERAARQRRTPIGARRPA